MKIALRHIVLLLFMLHEWCEGVVKNSVTLYCNNTDISNIDGLVPAIRNSNVEELVIQLCESRYVVNSVLQFYNKSSVTLIGVPTTTIICSSKEDTAGLEFYKVGRIKIQSVIFKGCKSEFTSFSENFTAGIVIVKSFFILIENVALTSSRGKGICIMQSSGHITVKNSTFEENYELKKK